MYINQVNAIFHVIPLNLGLACRKPLDHSAHDGFSFLLKAIKGYSEQGFSSRDKYKSCHQCFTDIKLYLCPKAGLTLFFLVQERSFNQSNQVVLKKKYLKRGAVTT